MRHLELKLIHKYLYLKKMEGIEWWAVFEINRITESLP